MPNHIHISRKTAEQLRRERRGNWIRERPELVSAKGKGSLQTYFAEPNRGGGLSSCASESHVDATNSSNEDDLRGLLKSYHAPGGQRERLIEWNVVLLEELLKNVVAHRMTNKSTRKLSPSKSKSFYKKESGVMVRDEVLDVIELPTYEAQASTSEVAQEEQNTPDVENMKLSPAVMAQLHQFVSAIADCYPPNVRILNWSHRSQRG